LNIRLHLRSTRLGVGVAQKRQLHGFENNSRIFGHRQIKEKFGAAQNDLDNIKMFRAAPLNCSNKNILIAQIDSLTHYFSE
tara:strand:+ start:785 stop:1027 length:243 start_codon:yes stop_codon:yes gene_type:complete